MAYQGGKIGGKYGERRGSMQSTPRPSQAVWALMPRLFRMVWMVVFDTRTVCCNGRFALRCKHEGECRRSLEARHGWGKNGWSVGVRQSVAGRNFVILDRAATTAALYGLTASLFVPLAAKGCKRKRQGGEPCRYRGTALAPASGRCVHGARSAAVASD